MSNSQVNTGANVGGGSGGSNVSGGGAGGGSGTGSSGGSSSHTPATTHTQQHTPPQVATVGTTNTSTRAVAGSNTSADALNLVTDSSPRESGDDSEDESEILEESPCGRWLKRREEVDQRDVPGIDCVHLAMDTEEGVEVVWNEVQYANLQELKSQEDKMRQVFDNLLQLDHQNIVKFHRYWTDTQNADRPRVIFITEYMSSGSLKQFLKRTKRNAKRLPLEAWRRWCTQILSALSYLHSCTPPIIHGNLTCDSIFIQHNGLVKIGSVVPDAVHYNVRQQQHKAAEMVEQGALHFMAPEYGAAEQLTAAVDIYAFGMCALEMAALEIQNSSGSGGGGGGGGSGSGGSESTCINEESILRTINSLENDLQRDLIFKCLRRNPSERPSANDLLFHPLLFEVHSLKLLAAHCLVFSPRNRTMFSETVIDGMMQRYNRPEVIMAHIKCGALQDDDAADTTVANTTNVEDEDLQVQQQQQEQQHQHQHQEEQQEQTLNAIREYRLSDVPSADKLEKFVEDVKFGVYPLTAFSVKKPPHFRSRAASPERADSVKSVTPEPVDIESRRIVNMMCSVKKLKEDSSDILMTILLRMDDKMNRQLSCAVTEDDTAADLTQELVRLGFVHIDDQDKIQALLEETLRNSFAEGGAAFEFGAPERTFSATINEQPGGGGGGSGIYNNNQNAILVTKTAPAAGTAFTTLNQLERNWSVADTDATTVLQPQPSMQLSSAMASPLQTTSALSLTATVPMVAADALAGTVMYVPHEQITQQQQQQQHQHQHSHSHPHHQQSQSQTQTQTQSQSLVVPQSQPLDGKMVSMDEVDTTPSLTVSTHNTHTTTTTNTIN